MAGDTAGPWEGSHDGRAGPGRRAAGQPRRRLGPAPGHPRDRRHRRRRGHPPPGPPRPRAGHPDRGPGGVLLRGQRGTAYRRAGRRAPSRRPRRAGDRRRHARRLRPRLPARAGRARRRGTGERRARFAALATEPRTLVFFEAPHRVAASLSDLAAAFGPDRPAAVCRELTKTYEEIRRGSLGELAGWAAAEAPRGEITLVVAGAAPAAVARPAAADLAAAVARSEASGTPRKAAIAAVAAAHGLPKREVYEAVVRSRVTGSP